MFEKMFRHAFGLRALRVSMARILATLARGAGTAAGKGGTSLSQGDRP
jgi:hypothetical protein